MSPLSSKSTTILPYLLLLTGEVLPVSAGRNDPPAGWDADEAAQRIERAWDVYNLPYGTLGIVTHVVMLWTLACHLDGRSPFRPWRKLEFDWYNLANLGVTTMISISLLAVNLSAEDRSPGMTSLAVLHLVYSIVVDGVTVHRFLKDRAWEKKRKSENVSGDDAGASEEKPKVERQGLSLEYTPWLVVLMLVSLINSQIMGTLDDIGRNPRLNGVTYFDSKIKINNYTGLVFTLCAILGGILALLAAAPCAFYYCVAKRRERYNGFMVYIFAFFGLVCCLGFILAMDYTVGVVTGNDMGTPAAPRGKGTVGMFWTYFAFQYVPVFTF